MKMNMNKKTVVITGIVTLLVTIGLILYGLANRYLIEHVELEVASTVSAAANASTSASATISDQVIAPTSDDWNYKGGDIEIGVKKVQTGSGSDTITYYVADVKLTNTSTLLTAFAKNKFGRNIVENTSTIASAHDAILAINGDYYGFRNDGVIIRNGTLYQDVPARDAIALFKDGTLQSFNETQLSTAALLAKKATNTFSFGPILVKNGTVADDFNSVKIDSNFGNRSIQAANPRTGISDRT